MNNAGRDFRPVWRKTRGAMRKDQRQHVRQQRASSGARWKPLAASTVEKRTKKARRRKKNFTRKGRLRKPVQKRLDRILSGKILSFTETRMRHDFMEIRQSKEWAKVHQAGGRVGKGATVPAREFLWVSRSFVRIVAREMEIHLKNAWDGKW